jgi:crotonobetainyl-CoA:carnitine CoA-transferase CaiB-like acyl-CoA transferase
VLRQQLDKHFLSLNRDEWVKLLQEIDVCVAPVYSLAEVFQDPQILHRNMVYEIDHPRLGIIKQLGFPVKMSLTPAAARLYPPDLGEHNVDILTTLGYSHNEIRAFCQQGII